MRLLKTYRIITIIFVVAIVGYFIASLSIMTDIFRLNIYKTYLNPEAFDFYNKVDAFNIKIFATSAVSVVAAMLILLFKLNKKINGFKLTVVLDIVGLIILTFLILHTIESFNLLKEFNNLELIWLSNSDPASYGYIEPTNLWLLISVLLMSFALVSTIAYLTVVNVGYALNRKEVVKDEEAN